MPVRAFARISSEMSVATISMFQPANSSAFYGVHQSEDVAQQSFVIGILLELDQFDIEFGEAFAAFRQKLAK